MKAMENKTFCPISTRHFIYVLFLSLAVFQKSIGYNFNPYKLQTGHYVMFAGTLFMISMALIAFWTVIANYFKAEVKAIARAYASLVLSPIILLLFWPNQASGLVLLFPFAVIVLTQMIFFVRLNMGKSSTVIDDFRQHKIIAAGIIIYIIFFSYLGICKHNNFSFFNPKDFAVYNQTFWNTIHGRIFQNSAYGSNLTCHNTVFFFFLVPFYYLFPFPQTLLVLQTIFLALSAIPFYLIARRALDSISSALMTFSFMLYPYLVSQNFTPPHEISFAPMVILFAFYFYLREEFLPFMLLLAVSVFIKEHIALIAIMIGLFSIFYRKSFRWIIGPIILGAAGGAFSLWLISHFQVIYGNDSNAAWILSHLKNIKGGHLNTISFWMSKSNAAHWHIAKKAFLLIAPLGLVCPFFSAVSLLGLPEFLVSFLLDRPAMLSPIRHYNILTACFLLIGCTEGIKKLSNITRLKNDLKMEQKTICFFIAVFIFSSAVVFSHTWSDLIFCSNNQEHVKIINQALVMIPQDASVKVSRNLAVHVSSRRQYSLLDDLSKTEEEYILIDNYPGTLAERQKGLNRYVLLFNKKGIMVLKRRETWQKNVPGVIES